MPISIYLVWEKLRERKFFASLHQEILQNRKKKIDKIRQLRLNKNIDSLIQHIENKLCFTNSEFKHNRLVMELLIFPLLITFPKATEPRHMITTESKMANIDCVFPFVKKSVLNNSSFFLKITTKINSKEIKKFSRESPCIIL